jgi:hypothetical protein
MAEIALADNQRLLENIDNALHDVDLVLTSNAFGRAQKQRAEKVRAELLAEREQLSRIVRGEPVQLELRP